MVFSPEKFGCNGTHGINKHKNSHVNKSCANRGKSTPKDLIELLRVNCAYNLSTCLKFTALTKNLVLQVAFRLKIHLRTKNQTTTTAPLFLVVKSAIYY